MRKTYLLESIDLDKKSGVLKIKNETPKNAPWTTFNVSLSGLLISRIKSSNYRGLFLGDTYVGTKFTSELCSRDFSENPFCLVEHLPQEGCDIPHNYRLNIVDQAGTFTEQLTDVFGDKAERWGFYKAKKKAKWVRFVQVKTFAKREDWMNIIPV